MQTCQTTNRSDFALRLAGLLIGEPDRAPGHFKSLVLLFGRFALTVLFVTVGITQVSSHKNQVLSAARHWTVLRA